MSQQAAREVHVVAESVSQEAYERIRDKLVSGDMTPGTRLVNRVLAREVGVSVSPVREALNRLASEGLVEHIPGAGTFVRRLSNRDLAKLYSFREHLEVYAVREAANHRQPYQVDELERICGESKGLLEAMRARGGGKPTAAQMRNWLNLDRAFHETVIEAADNPWLARASGNLHLLSHAMRSKAREGAPERAESTIEEHEAIVRAIASGDGEAGAETMRQHIRYAGRVHLSKTQ